MPKIEFPDAQAGVHSIFQFGLAVPDLDEQVKFLTAFGLAPTRSGDQIEVRSVDGDHFAGLLRRGFRDDPRPSR